MNGIIYDVTFRIDVFQSAWFSERPSKLLQISVKVLVTQLCLTLCDPLDCSWPDSSVHGILQARILEWVAIPFSKESSQPRDRTWVSCIAGTFDCLSHQGSPLQISIVHLFLLFSGAHGGDVPQFVLKDICFNFLALTNKAAMTIHVQHLVWAYVLISLG